MVPRGDADVLTGRLARRGAEAFTLGAYDEAVETFAHLARLEPARAVHWQNQGTVLRALGRYDEALQAYARAFDLGARHFEWYYLAALVHLDRQDLASARALLERAVSLQPAHAEARLVLARACFESGDTEAGIAALENWQELPDVAPAVLAEIGQRLQGAGEARAAAAILDRLEDCDTLDAPALLALFHLFERANRLDEAGRCLDALESGAQAAGLRSQVASAAGRYAQRRGRHEEAIAHLRRALEGSGPSHGRFRDLFPLARSLDALGRAGEAMGVLAEAHVSQVDQIRLSAPLIAASGPPDFSMTKLRTDPVDIERWAQEPGPERQDSPVFVVAFPRSGTTLLEQMLDAHPALASMDEQSCLQHALEGFAGVGADYPRRLAGLSREALDGIRARYWRAVHRHVDLAPGQRLVDKNPLNLLRLPAIRRLFPRAQVVLAIRHPLDVLLSCHMQQFTAPEFALLSADLPALARAHTRAFEGWYDEQSRLGASVHEVRYERLVTDFEAEARALIDFLGLTWHEAVLAPAAHARARGYISTPSYSQVIEPVHGRAVERWRAYATHLLPLKALVAPSLGRWGYAA